MSTPAPSIEEIVAALTARLASAGEIRAHAQRLLAVAEAQDGLALREAVAAFGEEEGARLYQAVSAIHGLRKETRSRVAEVPALAAELAAPWDRAPVEGQASIPSPAKARVPAATTLHGVAIEPGDLDAANRLVAEARTFARTGDRAGLEARAGKLVGRHRWRADLLEAAFAAASEEEAGRDGEPDPDAPPPPADPVPGPDASEPAGREDPVLGAASSQEADDVVFGDGPDASPVLTRQPVAAPTPLRPPVLALGDGLPDPGAGWGVRRPPRPRAAANGSAALAPSLFAHTSEGG